MISSSLNNLDQEKEMNRNSELDFMNQNDPPLKRQRLNSDRKDRHFCFDLGRAMRALEISSIGLNTPAEIVNHFTQNLLESPWQVSRVVRPILLELVARLMLQLESGADDALIVKMSSMFSLLLPTTPQLDE